MSEDSILNLQLKGMMNAYDMSNLFLVAGYTKLAKLHYSRFQYLMKVHTTCVHKIILRDTEIPNSGKVESMYPTPLSKESAIALIPTAIKTWIDWGEEFLKELDIKEHLYKVILKDLKTAKAWSTKFPLIEETVSSTDESIPPMRQLMKAKLLETSK